MNIGYYTDKYFTRTRMILQAIDLNPTVTMQVFIRDEVPIFGIDESVRIIRDAAPNSVIYSIGDGEVASPGVAAMVLEAPICDIIELETIYLGIISCRTSVYGGYPQPNVKVIADRVNDIIMTMSGRPLYYGGARHWHYQDDNAIGSAALAGGASGCSTDAGSRPGDDGMGTMPHVLPIILSWIRGNLEATRAAAVAFNQFVEPGIPRIILVDTFNNELDDAIYSLNGIPHGVQRGVRLDTCGENIGQRNNGNARGVSVESAIRMRVELDQGGHKGASICLSSGFGNREKVQKFVDAEEAIGFRIFNSLIVGKLWDGICATADIVKIEGELISKKGREWNPDHRLSKVI